MTSTKTILSRILFLLYLAAIAFLCFMKVDKMPDIQRVIFGIPADKLAHFLMFLPFPILAFLAYDHVTDKPWRCVVFAVMNFLCGAAIALLTEYVQGLLPYRSRDLNDLKADLLAIGISTLLVFIIDIFHAGNRN